MFICTRVRAHAHTQNRKKIRERKYYILKKLLEKILIGKIRCL